MGYFQRQYGPDISDKSEQAVEFLKLRGLTAELLYKQKILPEGTDITDFVDEMRYVEANAREFGTKLRWFCDDSPAMAYVAPKSEKNTINFNLKTIVFNSQLRGTIRHEFQHLKQERVTGNAYSPPALDELSNTGRSLLFRQAGLPNLAIREAVEGLVQASTERMEGADKNCAYTYFEVPAMKKFDDFMQARVGVSPIACFVEMSHASMSRLRHATITLNNQLITEQALKSKGIKLTYKQLKQALAMSEYEASEGDIIKNSDEAWDVIRNTPAPVIETVVDTRRNVINVLNHRNETEIVLSNIFGETLVNSKGIYTVRNRTAQEIVDLIGDNGENVVLSA